MTDTARVPHVFENEWFRSRVGEIIARMQTLRLIPRIFVFIRN